MAVALPRHRAADPTSQHGALVVAPHFVLRTPLLPLGAFTGWASAGPDASAAQCRALRQQLRALVEQPAVREALLLASPELAGNLPVWRAEPESPRGQRLERALVRYVARMAARATPFGLFAGVSVGSVGRSTSLLLAPRSEYRRRTRLDNDYLFALSEELGGDRTLRAALTYRPNSSLYRTAGRWRYAEARRSGRLRTYHLVALEPTPHLDATLARAQHGARLHELTAALATETEVAPEEAGAFIDELVDAQILVPELGVTITGAEPIVALQQQLAAAPAHPAGGVLAAAASELQALDSRPPGGELAPYQAVAGCLGALPAPVELGRLFQVDMHKPARATLGPAVVAEIARGIEILRQLTPAPDGGDGLAEFRRAFRERYEDREVPLAEALDEESGIGFEKATGPGSEGAPLLAGLDFPGTAAEARPPWDRARRFLLARLQRATAAGAREIELSAAELDELRAARPVRHADALSVLVQLAAASPEALERGQFRVLLESGGGPSGARILGRFCHLSRDLHAAVQQHLRAEEALRPEAIFAEIAHLNEGRIGNIQCRPVLRDHEIPFLGRSGAPPGRQLPLADLLVAVRGDRIVLRSRRLGREVLPRLSTAHNFRLRSLGVYRFLCALQNQDGGVFHWSWGPLEQAPFLPRVRCGRLVFARARWRLGDAELAPLARAARGGDADTPAGRERLFAAVQALRAAQGLPRFVMLSDGDNELPVDLDNALSVDSFAHLVKARVPSRAPAVLQELFAGPDELVATGPEGGFSSELVVLFTRAPGDATATAGRPGDAAPVPGGPGPAVAPDAVPPAAAAAPAPAPGPAVRRRFAPGSEWLFVKLYTGPSTADRLLREVVAPVRRAALDSGAASTWFFLRYGDPEHHLRVRFRGPPARLAGEVLPALERAAAPLLEDGSLWRLAVDTYERELERYGGPAGIEHAEALFCADSEAVLGIVELLDGDAGADARWRLAFRGAHMLLCELGLTPAQRTALITACRDGFAGEFGADTALHRQLGQRFRRESADLLALLACDPARDAGHWLAPGLAQLAARSRLVTVIAEDLRRAEQTGRLGVPVSAMAQSFVHMHVNRLLHASQRAQELVLYDLLRRSYAALEHAARGIPPAGRERS